jgi:amidophosphoribosyltransferase
MAKDVGAKKVIFASAAPPIRFSNVYGIDMPSPQELVAFGRTTEEVAETIGADLVIYQNLEDLVEACRQFNPEIKQFDCSVFTGEYVTGGVDERYLDHIQKLRNDKAKAKKAGIQLEMAEREYEGGCSGPMNGADSLIGLPNHSPKLGPHSMPSPQDTVGLHNSWHSGA